MITPSHTIVATAPGSLMLMGEHAVLHGRLALVAAVDSRLSVAATPRSDRIVSITSSLGEYRSDLDSLAASHDFRFLVAAIREARPATGLDLVVTSEFSHTIGFGSSAAVTVAAVAAIRRLSGLDDDRKAIVESALRVIRSVQGMGSGADVAASTHGGIVLYRATPMEIDVLPHTHPLTAVYSGSKMPTPEVVALVEKSRALYPSIFEDIYNAIDQCVMDAADAVHARDWATVGRMMNVNQGLMDAMGVSNAALSRIVYALRGAPGILGAKISGSGLGDCAIGLGSVGSTFSDPVMPVTVDTEGVVVEEA